MKLRRRAEGQATQSLCGDKPATSLFLRVVLLGMGVFSLGMLSACGSGGADAGGPTEVMEPNQGSNYVLRDPVTIPPTSTPPAEGAEGATSDPSVYIVEAGDGLCTIAKKFGIKCEALAAYNGWNINTQVLHKDDTVKLPPEAKLTESSSSSESSGNEESGSEQSGTEQSASEESGGGCTHIIEENENPSKVAAKYGITVDELRAANPEVIKTFLVKAELKIPSNGNC